MHQSALPKMTCKGRRYSIAGVGSFTAASENDPAKKIQTKIKEGTPLLGICLGYSFLEESKRTGNGLAFKAKVVPTP
jgi:imidazoleglycerol phosphate synthase glutamine amidotransferase subunit HisH